MTTDILLVDGYNIIGAWEELGGMKRKKLADARDRLIERMAEYKAHTGWRVIIIFDAHLVPGIEKRNGITMSRLSLLGKKKQLMKELKSSSLN